MRGLLFKNRKGETIYTLHTQEHSQKIIEKLERITDICNNVKNKKCHINDESEFILYCSAWLHDLGCIISRKNHGKLSNKIIQENSGLFEGITGYERLIGMICEVHTYDRKLKKDPISKLPKEIVLENGERLYPQYLAGIFRLADACDLDRKKAPKLVYMLLSQLMGKDSRKFWKAHSNVFSCGFINDKILITYFERTKYDNFIFNELQKQFNEVYPILQQYDFPIKQIKSDYLPVKDNWRVYIKEK